MIPVWVKPVAIGAAIGLVLLAAWLLWPAPGPSPAEKALREQNEALQKANEQLAADAAARVEEANQLREEANAEVEKIPALRTRRRTARADDVRRRDAIAQTSDDGAVDALRVQHARTREALRAVRARAEPAEGGVGGSVPR